MSCSTPQAGPCAVQVAPTLAPQSRQLGASSLSLPLQSVPSLGAELLRALPTRRRWTDQEDAELRRLLAAGLSYAAAGKALGRTRDAVSDRLRVLNGRNNRTGAA